MDLATRFIMNQNKIRCEVMQNYLQDGGQLYYQSYLHFSPSRLVNEYLTSVSSLKDLRISILRELCVCTVQGFPRTT